MLRTLLKSLVVSLVVSLGILASVGCRNTGGGTAGGGCGGGCCRGKHSETFESESFFSLPSRVPAATAQPGLVSPVPMATGLPYGGQKTCPVTGDELGSMGQPRAVTVKGQTIYVCCKGCVQQVQNDPDLYLQKVEAERQASAQ
jgi:hypothetical protein